jgi:hypothetical protein
MGEGIAALPLALHEVDPRRQLLQGGHLSSSGSGGYKGLEIRSFLNGF